MSGGTPLRASQYLTHTFVLSLVRMAPAATPPAAPPAEEASIAVPAMVGFCGVGVAAVGFGAGYGSRSYFTTAAYKDLLEKFPDAPTPEVEALARSGATRAFLGGTALCGLMGVGAVLTARMYGINNAAELGDEIKKWLPTQARLEVRGCGAPYFPLSRTPCTVAGAH